MKGCLHGLDSSNGFKQLGDSWHVLYDERHARYRLVTSRVGQEQGIVQCDFVLRAPVLQVTSSLLFRILKQTKKRCTRFRLTAVYAIILGFIATVYAYLGTGPNWREIQMHSEVCQANWWQNLLYINNFFYSFDTMMVLLKKSIRRAHFWRFFSNVTVYGRDLVLGGWHATIHRHSTFDIPTVEVAKSWRHVDSRPFCRINISYNCRVHPLGHTTNSSINNASVLAWLTN